ncbi:hypothetical protein [Synoicihabitans lomoniglobus]|uniref:Haemin-degrading HemS/ChuX domain-containing protein n=1 Tax=Synoicihabitans lomoniglobus TaxID=2909285 RepID=A0AAF0CPM3_9BACT|nr:hypothetical protein [Opitutaceae bacterium LMO-M01]WED65494.1 hypothetical protein PXH66_01355 [Opitutaceae bacterium LMO-M01]
MIPRPSFTSFPAAPASRLSRCFATTADGRIPLTPDWPRLFARLAHCDNVARQTRHAQARLIRLGRLPAPGSAPLHWVDAHTELKLNHAVGSHAIARIALCPCCDSPGRIEVMNPHGSEFLQLCAPARMAPAVWAQIVASLTAGSPTQLPASDERAPSQHLLNLVDPRRLTLSTAIDRLAPLLAAWGDADHMLAVTLETAAAVHTERFHPAQVQEDGRTLQVCGDGATLQLARATVHQLGCGRDSSGPFLRAIDVHGASLITFRPGPNRATDHDRWHAATAEIFRP